MDQDSDIVYRPARREELAEIIALLAQDTLGKTRETHQDTVDPAYVDAFEAIERDPGNEVIVGVDAEGICATMQLSYIPNLTFKGSTRCQIEGVRVAERVRGQGLGQQMIEWAIARAQQKGCSIIQLTSNKTRSRTLAFYEALGFEASHIGFKMYLR